MEEATGSGGGMRGEGQVDVNDRFREGFNCNRRPNLTSSGYNNQETRTKNIEGGGHLPHMHTCRRFKRSEGSLGSPHQVPPQNVQPVGGGIMRHMMVKCDLSSWGKAPAPGNSHGIQGYLDHKKTAPP